MTMYFFHKQNKHHPLKLKRVASTGQEKSQTLLCSLSEEHEDNKTTLGSREDLNTCETRHLRGFALLMKPSSL